MASKSSASAKVKVTVSLNSELVKELDMLVTETGVASRSLLMEDALRKWLNEQKRQKIEREMEAYYLSLTDQEKQEDREWGHTAAEAARCLWED
jgi:metal-responsive CopG/Arc/MetJ family transcriptional regulator